MSAGAKSISFDPELFNLTRQFSYNLILRPTSTGKEGDFLENARLLKNKLVEIVSVKTSML
jgi:hypothetical protein